MLLGRWFKARRRLISSRHGLHEGRVLQHVLQLLQLHFEQGQQLGVVHFDLDCLDGLEFVVGVRLLYQLGEPVEVIVEAELLLKVRFIKEARGLRALHIFKAVGLTGKSVVVRVVPGDERI